VAGLHNCRAPSANRHHDPILRRDCLVEEAFQFAEVHEIFVAEIRFGFVPDLRVDAKFVHLGGDEAGPEIVIRKGGEGGLDGAGFLGREQARRAVTAVGVLDLLAAFDEKPERTAAFEPVSR
jgi:hypothetical protein